MTKLILPDVRPNGKPVAAAVPMRRCGNCYWRAPGPPGQTEIITCQAIPPTPMYLGMAADALNRPVPQIINAWPQLPANQKMCRLWTPPQGPTGDGDMG